MENNDSINECLGIKDSWFSERMGSIEKDYADFEKVDELMINQIKDIRLSELGEVDAKISQYEKKILLAGYLIGVERVRLTTNPISDIIDQITNLNSGNDE